LQIFAFATVGFWLASLAGVIWLFRHAGAAPADAPDQDAGG
jgi:cbb3-type cytochrome oxidase subunit 3